jgi:hypothetical protein
MHSGLVFYLFLQYSEVATSDTVVPIRVDRLLLLTRNQLYQGFLVGKLKSSLGTFYGRNHDIDNRYGISVSQMIMDMFCSS